MSSRSFSHAGRCFFSPCGEKKSPTGNRSREQHPLFLSPGSPFSSPLLLPPFADTARNWLPMIEINHYRPTTAGDDPDRLIAAARGKHPGDAGGRGVPRETPDPICVAFQLLDHPQLQLPVQELHLHSRPLAARSRHGSSTTEKPGSIGRRDLGFDSAAREETRVSENSVLAREPTLRRATSEQETPRSPYRPLASNEVWGVSIRRKRAVILSFTKRASESKPESDSVFKLLNPLR
ncbi:hypothetical protein BHE74_00024291 [Ensete ventricosum]|nr:hypothetical protein BHE74_00024291 [Ensete ventricosum]